MTDRPKRWWEFVRNEAAPGKLTLRVYGVLTSWPWFEDEISAAGLVKELDETDGVTQIDLHVNSPGGEAYEGVTIMNALRQHPARVTAHVDGMAASAASLLLLGAGEVLMYPGSQVMVHDASSFAFGFAADLQKAAEDLDHLSQTMAGVYADYTGGSPAEWRDIMRAETWFDGDEAVEAGLATRVVKNGASKDAEAAAAVAMLRQYPAVAHYRYQGRAQAPAPRTPARAGGSGTEGGRSVEITDEDFAALRAKLGLGDEAEIGDVLDALDEKPAGDGGQQTPAEDATAAAAPAAASAEVVSVDRATWDQVQADARLGRDARNEQVEARRAGKVDAAIAQGKIVPARREHWLTLMRHDEDGTTAVLDGLQPVFGTAELGYDGGTSEDSGGSVRSLEDVRRSPAYQNWKVMG